MLQVLPDQQVLLAGMVRQDYQEHQDQQAPEGYEVLRVREVEQVSQVHREILGYQVLLDQPDHLVRWDLLVLLVLLLHPVPVHRGTPSRPWQFTSEHPSTGISPSRCVSRMVSESSNGALEPDVLCF